MISMYMNPIEPIKIWIEQDLLCINTRIKFIFMLRKQKLKIMFQKTENSKQMNYLGLVGFYGLLIIKL